MFLPLGYSSMAGPRLRLMVDMLQGSENAGGTGGGEPRRPPSTRNRGSDEPHIGKYRLLKTIGKGNFAKVKLAKHVPTGKEVSLIFFSTFTYHSFSIFCARTSLSVVRKSVRKFTLVIYWGFRVHNLIVFYGRRVLFR